MTDRALLHAEAEPARLPGYGIIPAAAARYIALTSANENELNLWVRRLYTAPGTGDLVAMDSKARLFPPNLKRFLQVRDNTCRTPYCDAPIRHHDHATAWHDGGPTNITIGQGLCEACNHTKETPGWTAKPITSPEQRHTIATTTPTGHTYHSTAPPLPGIAGRPTAVQSLAPIAVHILGRVAPPCVHVNGLNLRPAINGSH